MRALYIAASGMTAQQTRIDAIANNLANVNTTAYKKDRANFRDVLYQELTHGGRPAGTDRSEIGGGVQLALMQKDHAEGAHSQTGDAMHVAINGPGYMEVETPDGRRLYTRDGALGLDEDRTLIHAASGYEISGGITIPEDADSFQIMEDGTVYVTTPRNVEGYTLGRLDVHRFSNSSGLRPMGGNLYAQTEHSGTPDLLDEDDTRMSQGALEGSNVDAAEELIQMIMAQRAYELNSKVVQAADEAMRNTAAIHR